VLRDHYERVRDLVVAAQGVLPQVLEVTFPSGALTAAYNGSNRGRIGSHPMQA
jgi:hypothetical protein